MPATSDSSIRIGVLVPGNNLVHEREFARLRPRQVSFRFRRFFYPPPGTIDYCEALVQGMSNSVRELREWGAQLIFVGCTTASMACIQTRFGSRLEELAGVPVITAAEAVLEAMEVLGIRSVAVASPYGNQNNATICSFLQSHGVTVAAIAGLGLDRSPEIWRAQSPFVTVQQLLTLGLSVDVSEAQALYLPCTGVWSLEVLEGFERQTGKLAVSSVQAGFWSSLRRLRMDARQPGNGRLLQLWDPVTRGP